MNVPRSGSTANAWTLVRMPERTRKVPTMLIETATTPSRIVQLRKRIARGEHAGRMEQRGRREPRHQAGVLDRVPEPPAAPAELVIGPVGPGGDAEREEDPRAEHPWPHRAGEVRRHLPGQQRADREAERDREPDIAEVERRRVEGQADVLQQRVEPEPFGGPAAAAARTGSEENSSEGVEPEPDEALARPASRSVCARAGAARAARSVRRRAP